MNYLTSTTARPMTTASRWAMATMPTRASGCGCRPARPCAPSTHLRSANVVLLQIGCTIAVHTGPYALGMGVMRRWKKQ